MQLPAALTEPLGWIGLTWPEADEEKLFEAGQRWITYGEQLRQISLAADRAAAQVWTGNEGDAVDAFRQWWSEDAGPELRLAEDADAAEIIGAALIAFAVVTLAMKIAFIVQLIILAIEVAQAIATAVVSFGATTAEIPGFVAATRYACRQLIKKVVTHVQTVIKDLLRKAQNLLKRVKSRRGQPRQVGPGRAPSSGPHFRHHTNGTQADFDQLYPELRDVNPNFHANDQTYIENCAESALATDRTLAGVPEAAAPCPPGMDWPRDITDTVGNGGSFRPVSGYRDIVQEMDQAGPGSRGIVWGRRFDPTTGDEEMGHVFNVVNGNGEIHFVDGQVGTWAYLENFGSLEFIRTN